MMKFRTLMEDANVDAKGKAKKYGLIFSGGEGSIDRGDFSDIEVYLDKEKFVAAVLDMFAEYTDDKSVKDFTSLDDASEHEQWEDFVDICFFDDNF